MTKHPLVSIIVLFYGQKEITELAVKSLLNTECSNFEIILVDNLSPDDSAEYLKRKFRQNRKIRVVNNPVNNLVAGGYNFGAQFAKGKYLVFFNNDIEVEPNWLSQLLLANSQIKYCPLLLQPKILSFHQKNKIDNFGGLYLYPGIGLGLATGKIDDHDFLKTVAVDYVQAIFMIESAFFKKVGGFDQWYQTHYEDLDFSLRAKKLGAKCYVCGTSIVYHKGSVTYKQQRNNELLAFHIKKNRIRTVMKNFSGLDKFARVFLLELLELIMILYYLTQFNLKMIKSSIKAMLTANKL